LIAKTEVVDEVPGFIGQYPGPSEPDELAEMGGRLCYLSWGRPNPETADNPGYIRNIIKQMHFSVLEHASVTFYIDGVTRNFTHELIRHRHLSFSEVSQRYVDVSEFPFVWHPGLASLPQFLRDDFEYFSEVAKGLYESAVEELVKQGKPRKEARQAARHILPSGTETRILVSGNLRAWREVLGKRLSPAADAEFREVAQKIRDILLEVAPATFADFEEGE
jgi:thymidylate synthase (FAD)